MSDNVNIKDIIDKTKNFDRPYSPAIPEGIHEVEVQSFERTKSKDKGYDMLTITVADAQDRTARVTQMLEIQWIEGTLRLIKGLYSHNAPEGEKEEAKDKINKFFDGAKDAADLQQKCIDILEKLVAKGCVGWLRVERKNPQDQYPDRALTAYEPSYRWKTAADEVKEMIDAGEEITDENLDDIFGK